MTLWWHIKIKRELLGMFAKWMWWLCHVIFLRYNIQIQRWLLLIIEISDIAKKNYDLKKSIWDFLLKNIVIISWCMLLWHSSGAPVNTEYQSTTWTSFYAYLKVSSNISVIKRVWLTETKKFFSQSSNSVIYFTYTFNLW